MEQLDALRAFIGRRSGIDWRNYGDRQSFLAEYRRILRDGRDARTMLRYLEMAARNAEEAGRPMTLPPHGVRRLAWDGTAWSYTASQYHPVEYRAAACQWLADAIAWHWDIPYRPGRRETVFRNARNAFGPGIAKRWFQ
jgi:hypothetical protein